MWGGTTLDTQNTVGLAYLGRVCTETKYTIIEEIGGFSAILVNYWIDLINLSTLYECFLILRLLLTRLDISKTLFNIV